jgi:hypothetical protein
MLQKIKKLPLLLILAMLLTVGSSGFAFYQYRELQAKNTELKYFKDAGLFYDSTQKQLVISPFIYDESNTLSRYISIGELKRFLTGSTLCEKYYDFMFGKCLVAMNQNPKGQDKILDDQASPAKYYGWFGSDKVELNINIPVKDFTNVNRFEYSGNYYSNSEKKIFSFKGGTNLAKDYDTSEGYKTSIKLEETTDGILTGKIDLFSQDNTNKLAGLSNDAVEKLNAVNMYGTYTAKDQKQYDVFLTKDKETVDNWKVKEIKGKVYFGNTYGYGSPTSNAFIITDNENYFSNENWNFKNLVDGQEVLIKGKAREYTPLPNNGNTVANYQPPVAQCEMPGGCLPQSKLGFPQPFSTNLGIFNIESVEKI